MQHRIDAPEMPARPRWRGPISLVVGLLAVGAANVAFHLMAGRLLGAGEYSSLSALLTILLALAVPAGAIQVALTAEVARIDRRGRAVRHEPTVLQFGAGGLVVSAVIVGCGPWMGSYLHLDGMVAPLLVGLFFPAALAGLVLRSVLLGRERYLTLATVLVVGVVVRLVGGLVLLSIRPTAGMALAVTLGSEVFTTAALWVSCRRQSQPTAVAWDLRIRVSELLGGVMAFAGFWLVVGIDTILARHQFVAVEAGAYAATALAARSVLYAPQAVVTAALPKYSLEGRAARTALFDSMLSSLVVGLVGVVGVLLLVQPVLEPLLGQSYSLSGPTLATLTVAALWAALLNALINYHLAQGAILRANASWIGVFLITTVGHLATESTMLSLVVLAAILLVGLLTSTPLLRPAHRPPTGPPSSDDGTLGLSVVVPTYNEGDRVAATIERIAEVVDDPLLAAEIVVVDDGSNDGTADAVARLTVPGLRLIRLERHGGKGRALRTGLAAADGNVIGFIDGDGDIDAWHLRTFQRELDHFGADAVIGSKRHRHSMLATSRPRRMVSAVGQLLIRTLFRLPVSDTQVGVKLFRRSMVTDVLARTREDGYLFDLEFLAIGAARGWNHVIESPVTVRGNQNSTISIGAVVGTLRDLVRFAVRLHSQPRPTEAAELSRSSVGWSW